MELDSQHMKFALSLILLWQLAWHPSVSASEPPTTEDWNQKSDTNGIKIFSREFPGSDVIAVRGMTTLPYPVEEVFAVMSDNIRSPEWVPMVEKKVTIREPNDRSRIEYATIKMNWPLKDRYTVAEGTLQIKPGNIYWISYKSVDGEYTDDSRIRARLDLSTFYLKPDSGNSTFIDITLLSDPMGSVPKFLVNAFQKNWPTQFLNGLRKQIEKVRLERIHPAAISDGPKVAH